ncbi:hypothetical protein KRX57_07400 [Weeksellaceae bacterium TAE3-ERU29]|nr:hypothetical protein [Weeksellaceae bacterium TAE3-ERU29]
MKKILLLMIVFFAIQKIEAQVIISDKDVSTSNLDANAVLKVESNKSGVLLPRLEKVRIEEKQINHEGELFFSKAHNCLMINIADKNEENPKWKCIAVMPEAIPKS